MEINKTLTSSLIISAFLALSSYAHGSQLTETYACDTCDYNDARNIATQEFEPFSCILENTHENPLFGTTEYVCETTQRTIIIANPLTETAYKFDISATNHNQYTDAPHVVVTDAGLTTPEQQALTQFYDINEEFRTHVSNFSMDDPDIVTSQQTNSSTSKQTLSQPMDTSSLMDSSGGSDCSTHPSTYLTGLEAQRLIRFKLAQGLKAEIGTSSWNDHYVETKATGFGFDLNVTGGGVQVSWEHNTLDAIASVKFGNPGVNVLVFNVSFVGDVSASGHRDLYFAMSLHKGVSLVDGIPIGNFMSGNVNDLTNVGVAECLIENLAQTAIEDLAWDSGTVDDGTSSTWTPGVAYPGGCTRQVKYRTCSITMDGVQTSTESSITTSC